MGNIINLLPDSVADKIAAGEVIGRPAAAVKELLENAIDAQASHIQLILKNAGTSLIKVVDNGIGMSPMDARLCFSRHATSKIKNAEDLFNLNTKGFRGEALASIAAIAQVELKTKQAEDELGTYIRIEGSKLIEQENCQCATGTQFYVKNLFYNVPARRNFLKKESIEMKYVLEEFQRIVLAHPNISFTLNHNDKEIYHLNRGNLKQRIVAIMNKKYNDKLLVLKEETTSLNISGFIGKPEIARKTRGQQYFFVNNRFVKHHYLQHAIKSCYEGIMHDELNPFFVIFLDIDPARIDVNVHPSKQEIKFEDEKLVYKLLKSVVQKALASHNVIPTIDFDQEAILDGNAWISKLGLPNKANNETYNPFNQEPPKQKRVENMFRNDFNGNKQPSPMQQNWQEALKVNPVFDEEKPQNEPQVLTVASGTILPSKLNNKATNGNENNSLFNEQKLATKAIQIHDKYIIYQIKTGILLVNQKAALERILYEKFKAQFEAKKQAFPQQVMFAQTISLPASESHILRSMVNEMKNLGIHISEVEANNFAIEAVPADLGIKDHRQIIELLLENYKASSIEENGLQQFKDKFLIALAKQNVQKATTQLNTEELNNFIDKLFACQYSYVSPSGEPTCTTLNLSDLAELFK